MCSEQHSQLTKLNHNTRLVDPFRIRRAVTFPFPFPFPFDWCSRSRSRSRVEIGLFSDAAGRRNWEESKVVLVRLHSRCFFLVSVAKKKEW